MTHVLNLSTFLCLEERRRPDKTSSAASAKFPRRCFHSTVGAREFIVGKEKEAEDSLMPSTKVDSMQPLDSIDVGATLFQVFTRLGLFA